MKKVITVNYHTVCMFISNLKSTMCNLTILNKWIDSKLLTFIKCIKYTFIAH